MPTPRILQDSRAALHLTRRSLLRTAAGAGAAAAMAAMGCEATPREAGVAPANAGRPPNVIIIFCDDLGYGDLGCYGATRIATPHIDRLAAEGRRFTNFYVASPLCSPSRAALMTGCYPARVGLANFVLRPGATRGLAPSEITIAEVLKSRGYATCAIGKWHLGFVDGFVPNAQGFDHYFGLYHNLDAWETKYFEDKGGTPLLRNGEVVERPADKDTLVQKYTAEAIQFIRAHKGGPFLLYLAHTMPHMPLGASEKFRGSSRCGPYGDAVQEIDWGVGELVRTIRDLGLERDTIIAFTSDNGPAPVEGASAGPLRGRKNTTYEGGLRVPAIFWGPGRIPAGTLCDEVATTMDFLVTFGRLAGAEPPTDRVIDGKDIRPLLFGEPGARSPYDAFFYHNGRGALEAVRAGRWKLRIARPTAKKGAKGPQPTTPTVQLFDLHADLGETTNQANRHPDIVARLKSLMQAHREDLQKHSRPEGQV